MVIVPLILMTLNRARKQRFDLHKKIARWTWPLWMYVSVTGVAVYLILYQIFPQLPSSRISKPAGRVFQGTS
jgi:protein SCO1/2/putative membrane protein